VLRTRTSAAIAVAFLLGPLVACRDPAPAPPAAQPPLTYDGATSISDRVLPLVQPALERRGVRRIEVRRSGAGRGLKALFAGEVDVAGLARPLSKEERDRKPYVAIIGYDALAVWVSDQNPVRTLTSAQLKDLFTGRITSWRSLGGREQRVVACTEHLDSERATLQAFQELALGGAPYGPVTTRVDPVDCLALVAGDPGAVTVASVAYGRPGLHAVTIDGKEPTPAHVRGGAYLLTRPLLLVARQPPSGALETLFDLLVSAEGQALVAQAGFVAAR
jgi:phosphate transport system substrate-binding protein